MKKILITGVLGLIGSEAANYFLDIGYAVLGIDNNFRSHCFGKDGDVTGQLPDLLKHSNFKYYNIDIRDMGKMEDVFKENKITALLHAAATPSHDWARSFPLEDFQVNCVATVQLLELARNYCKDAPFCHYSTNKLYGDNPNRIKLKELETRYDFDDPKYINGIDESFNIDNCLHSLYGAGKTGADVYVVEYGRSFGMNTVSLRAGCLTGPNHAAVELHGFVNYLIKCNLYKIPYNIFGYKGKMVRSNISSFDIVNFCNEFINNPRRGEIYNIGGGKENSISILEAIAKVEQMSGIKMITNYVEQNRLGDHLVWYEDISKLKRDYPNYKITKSLDDIFQEIYTKYFFQKEAGLI